MRLLGPAAVLLTACAHQPVSPAALTATRMVAVVSRIEAEAGPRSTVFRGDPSYRDRLAPRRIDDREADRRLAAALAGGSYVKDAQSGVRRLTAPTMTRFELAATLRQAVLDLLPPGHPWREVASPTDVGRALESFLVQEVPANAPDYLRLAELGVDTVLELLVEEYGMRGERGRAGLYLLGTARLFRLDGQVLYQRRFVIDEQRWGLPSLDPFEVARNARVFSERMKPVIAAIAAQVASDLDVGATSGPPPERPTPASAPERPPEGDDPL